MTRGDHIYEIDFIGLSHLGPLPVKLIHFPSLLEQEFTADPELATPPKDFIT